MPVIDDKVWSPPPLKPGVPESPTGAKCTWKVIISTCLPVLLSTGGSIEFWRLEWFDGDAGKFYLPEFMPHAIGLCWAAMVWGGYIGFKHHDQWAGKLALAAPVASALMFLPYIFYFYKWKDLPGWPW